MRFKKNDVFTIDNEDVTVLDLLGEGGQGEVYKVKYKGNILAFKFYKDIPSDDFKYNLRNNIMKGAPSKNFLWPQDFIEFEDGYCGYLMDLRGKEYESFVSYLTGKSRFKYKSMMLNWCIELVQSFKSLHEKGYSYQDLNDGSFFLNPETGDLLICDNDNVSANKTNLGILGKMRYMAPEIVRGDKDKLTGERQLPDVHSDRFSLAVILFLTLCLGNPFEGERLKKYVIVDEKAESEMFGSDPVYIYSEYDKSNRPIRGYHTAVLKRYPLLPEYIKNAFHKTFTEGLKDRENSRITEIEWVRLLSRYRDELITCSCGFEYPYGLSERKRITNCPNCNQPTRKFCYLSIGKNRILLEPGKHIYKFHLDKYSGEYNTVVGTIIQNKNNPNFWGIKMFNDTEIMVKDMSNNEKAISANGVIPIIAGLKIKFSDNAIGQIIKENN